jgi:hypothetical protein
MALLHAVGSALQHKTRIFVTSPLKVKVCSKVNVAVANEGNMMTHYVPQCAR